ncbi:MAG: hypothetical protein JNJ47_07125 [Alphaproteobacteria bacterium]|nr:hypothetical protein [Alphaproteobacteria bacterium]
MKSFLYTIAVLLGVTTVVAQADEPKAAEGVILEEVADNPEDSKKEEAK